MKISDMISQLTALQTVYGDLEVLSYDSYAIDTIVTEVVTANEAREWDMVEGERYAIIVDNR